MLAHHTRSLFRTSNAFGLNSISVPLVQRWPSRFLSTAREPSTLLIVEHQDNEVLPTTFHVLSAAQALKQPISFLLCTHEKEPSAALMQTLAKYQPTQVWVVSHPSFAQTVAPELLATSLVELLKAQPFSHVFGAHSSTLKNALPRAAACLDVSMLADVVQVHDAATFTRPIYAGNVLCRLASNDTIRVITVRPTAFPAAAQAPEAATKCTWKPVTCTATPLSTFVSESKATSDRPELDTARIVVAGGRGMKSAEQFKMLYALADKLGAAVGASRAAVDAGYVDNALQIGQTGKVVAPSLYLGVGISGAIQHLAGMKDAKVICAINNDPDAPIFHVADYGLVADLFQAVPELTEKV